MTTRKDLLLWLPRKLTSVRTYKMLLFIPMFLAALVGFVALLIVFLGMVVVFMAFAVLFAASLPFILVAALVFGPEPVKDFFRPRGDWVFEHVVDPVMLNGPEWIMDRMDDGMDRFEKWVGIDY